MRKPPNSTLKRLIKSLKGLARRGTDEPARASLHLGPKNIRKPMPMDNAKKDANVE
jgi:hypothetical protein